jgi:predicted permease
MNLILKQLIIITGTFLVILWFQSIDDKKHNKTRETFYEKYKFPILVSAIIGFVINVPEIISSVNGESCESEITKIK